MLQKDEEKQKLVGQIEESLKVSGLDAKTASALIKSWSELIGHEVTPEDLRKVLSQQSGSTAALGLLQIFFDLAAAFGAYAAGNTAGAAIEQLGGLSPVLQAVAYFLSGYYLTGAILDTFKLGVVSVAAYQFQINADAYLLAVERLAGGSTGLDTVDKVGHSLHQRRAWLAIWLHAHVAPCPLY